MSDHPSSHSPSAGTTVISTGSEQNRVVNHHTLEWSSGSRGGGKVPADFGWHTNPKQTQEEAGTAATPEQQDR